MSDPCYVQFDKGLARPRGYTSIDPASCKRKPEQTMTLFLTITTLTNPNPSPNPNPGWTGFRLRAQI